jgi:hypothetical protein
VARLTHAQRLAELILGRPFPEWFDEHRGTDENPRSYRLIARDLYEQTNGQVDVAGETIRGWMLPAEPDKATA